MTAGDTRQGPGGGGGAGGWIEQALREHEEAAGPAAASPAEPSPAEPGGRPVLPVADRERQVLERIDRARRRRPRVREERVTMSHGAGGKATRTLVEAIFLDAFRNPLLEPLEDAAGLSLSGCAGSADHGLLRGLTAVLPRR